MAEDHQTARWAREIGALWAAGFIDQCHEQLMHNITMQPIDNEETASTAPSESPDEAELARMLMEHDYAALHNAVLAHFLAKGEPLPLFKVQELVQWRLSASVETLWPILQRFAYGISTTAPPQPKPSSLGALLHLRPQSGSKLDPHSYTRDSIEASLAAIGPLQPLAWYNLAVLHTARGQYRVALKTCDELLDLIFPALLELHHPLAIKLGLLFIYLIVKLNFPSHPRQANILTDMEKVISHRLSHTSGSEHLVCLEQNVWFYILRAQLSMILLRIKSSKREVSAMMSAYSKWQLVKMGTNESTISSASDASKDASSSSALPSTAIADPINCATQFVKSRLLALRSNPDKSEADLKTAAAISVAPGPFYNDLGVLAFHKRRYAAASLYFLKASQANQKLRQSIWPQVTADSRKHLQASVPNITIDVSYNMGLQMLLLGQYEGAIKSFKEVVDKYMSGGYVNCSPAILLLRLSEAQLALYCSKMTEAVENMASEDPTKKSGTSSTSARSDSTEPESSSSSSSSNRLEKPIRKSPAQVLREGGLFQFPRMSSVDIDPVLNSAIENANMSFMLLLRFGKSGTAPPASSYGRGVGSGSYAAQQATQNYALVDHNQLTPRDYLLKIYVQVILAWMSLETENLAKAIEYAAGARQDHAEFESSGFFSSATASASNLGGNGDFSAFTASEKAQFDHYYFLAHLYHAEAELRLGNVQAALAGLEATPTHLSKFPLLAPTHTPLHPLDTGPPIAPSSIASATSSAAASSSSSSSSSSVPSPSATSLAPAAVSPKVALLCNMAAVWIVKKDFAQAQKLVMQALTQAPHFLPAVSLQVYLELASGHVEVAVRLMSDNRVSDLLARR